MLLARPYPVEHLDLAREAIAAAVSGDLAPLQRLYALASRALQALDPDEVADQRRAHPDAATRDALAARAALDASDDWEGIVAIGATVGDPRRFRGFAWLAAHRRFGLEPAATAERFADYARGADLPDTSPEDSALFVALPALVGLGPELPDELPGPCPLPGTPVWQQLGLPEADWEHVDPIDALAIPPATCRAHYAGLTGPWRDIVARCLESGLVVRAG